MCYDDILVNSRGGAAVSGPLLDLGQFVDEEDAFALGLPAGFHDPGAGWILAVLLHKQIIISREHERHRNKVCIAYREKLYIISYIRERFKCFVCPCWKTGREADKYV